MVGRPDPLEGFPSSFRGATIVDPDGLERFARDASHLSGLARAVVRPQDPTDVERLVRWARGRRQPLVGRGGGTSLEGGSVPLGGAVVVDFSEWTSIGPIDPATRTVRVGPGVLNHELHERLKPYGMFFPPNPGSWTSSTIGGNVATNASGPRSFRYGSSRGWVREVEAVLGTGERVRFGHPLRKRSVGPDLLGILVGSEGTLGLFTEILLGLAPAPARRCGLAVPLPDGISLGRLALGLAADSALCLSAVEYVDRGSGTLLARASERRLPEGAALVLIECESADEDDETRQFEQLLGRLRSLGVIADPTVYPDADRLWTLRGSSGGLLDRALGPRVREDVGVPLSQVDALVRTFERLGQEFEADVYVYGHLGDGNLHPSFVLDPTGAPALKLRTALFEEVHRLGGTISSEHGIGALKREFLESEIGPAGARLLRALKSTCDPEGILNPGKLFEESKLRGAEPPSTSPGDGGAIRTPSA